MAPRKPKLPTALPENFELTDTEKNRWKLGKIIGQGGFGLIYLASQDLDKPVAQDSHFVIKLEYHENGPLFSELKFYQRAAKLESIHRWKTTKKMDFLGIPAYWGSGLAEHNGKRYRFMVMDRLGTDLQKVCDGNGAQLKPGTVLQLGCTVLDVLEYIHENEYVHADVKASNLMLGYRDPSEVYLADYGLSYRFCPEGVHKDYKPNPKKGHNGTIEYTSLDAHNGAAPSRRGDLQVLAFCLLHWLCGTLPWDSVLNNPTQVHEAKARLMDNLPNSVQQLPLDRAVSDKMADFFLHVKELTYEQRPDYQALRTLLCAGGRRAGGGQGGLDLSGPSGELAGGTTRGPDRSKGTGQDRGSAIKKPGRRGEQVVEEEEDDERGHGEKARAGNTRAPLTTKPDKTRPRGSRSNPAPEEDGERPRPIAACHLRGPPIGPRAQPDLGKSRTKNKKPVQEKSAEDFDLTVTSGPQVNPRLPRHAPLASPAKTTSRWDQEAYYSRRPSLTQTGRSGQTHRPWEEPSYGEEDPRGDEGDDQRWVNRRYSHTDNRGYKQQYNDDDGDSDHGDRETQALQPEGSWSSRIYCAAGLVFILLAFLLALRHNDLHSILLH
ncbi:serine/threonine-protein kinase VRK2 isoform X2 [Hypomesus transpacificus]|uniref:serine/threonine-protein kinase VRK2 isoform X2 n=1 Tax=Hypomesus transpacificus TaxID=137520 RepID=UPI001F086B81|nr:serine/threonine-protein kinase VRK2 isoform X2 [Hypomesus transpacificus]